MINTTKRGAVLVILVADMIFRYIKKIQIRLFDEIFAIVHRRRSDFRMRQWLHPIRWRQENLSRGRKLERITTRMQ